MFGFSYVPASLVGFDPKAVTRGEPIYQDLREKIRTSAIVHVGETSWRNNGRGHYVWFTGNENLAFFHIDRHRSAEVAKAIFGNDFAGTLVRDRYAAYNAIGANWQFCLAHILTTTEEIRREHALLPETEKTNTWIPSPAASRISAPGHVLSVSNSNQATPPKTPPSG